MRNLLLAGAVVVFGQFFEGVPGVYAVTPVERRAEIKQSVEKQRGFTWQQLRDYALTKREPETLNVEEAKARVEEFSSPAGKEAIPYAMWDEEVGKMLLIYAPQPWGAVNQDTANAFYMKTEDVRAGYLEGDMTLRTQNFFANMRIAGQELQREFSDLKGKGVVADDVFGKLGVQSFVTIAMAPPVRREKSKERLQTVAPEILEKLQSLNPKGLSGQLKLAETGAVFLEVDGLNKEALGSIFPADGELKCSGDPHFPF